MSVDVHEISANVERHHPTFAAVVVAFFLDVLLQTLNAVMRASALNATVRIFYECTLEDAVCLVVIVMMHHAVGKLSSKNLALFRTVHDEATGGLWLVVAGEKIIAYCL